MSDFDPHKFKVRDTIEEAHRDAMLYGTGAVKVARAGTTIAVPEDPAVTAEAERIAAAAGTTVRFKQYEPLPDWIDEEGRPFDFKFSADPMEADNSLVWLGALLCLLFFVAGAFVGWFVHG